MIPQFPEFVKLDPLHKPFVNQITKKFLPYSDHNFTSLFIWDVDSGLELSILNNNLVIKFKDYESDNKFYSFIGNTKIEETIEKLIHLSWEKGYGNSLLLLPKDNFTEEEILHLSKIYNIKEDRNNFDYILNIGEVSELKGSKFLNKRNKINKFLKTHNPSVIIKSISDTGFKDELTNAFNEWVENTKTLRGEEYINYDELKAFNKLMENQQHFDVYCLAVYVDGKIRGFSLFEIIDQEYAQHPFQKGNIHYPGIYEFLYHTLAKHLKEKGVKYMNIYQDLGHEGIRGAKMDYNPTFLKKYSISKKSTD